MDYKIILAKLVNKMKSPVVWGGLGTVVLWGLKTSGKLTSLGLTPESFQEGWNIITAAAIGILALNNPDDRAKF